MMLKESYAFFSSIFIVQNTRIQTSFVGMSDSQFNHTPAVSALLKCVLQEPYTTYPHCDEDIFMVVVYSPSHFLARWLWER